MRFVVSGLILLCALLASPASAQNTPPAEADPGVVPVRMIDRAEVRVSRVTLQAGAVRQVHVHDDVRFHLWVPMTGTFQISIGSDAPVAAAAGQAFYLARNTRHGFKNTGTTAGTVLEVFIKDSAAAANQDFAGALALGLAALQSDLQEPSTLKGDQP